MRIHEIVGLLDNDKTFTIIVPNSIERKLVFDRFSFTNLDVVFYDNTTMIVNGTCIRIFTISEVPMNHRLGDICLVEFPETLPDNMFRHLTTNCNDVIFTNEIM